MQTEAPRIYIFAKEASGAPWRVEINKEFVSFQSIDEMFSSLDTLKAKLSEKLNGLNLYYTRGLTVFKDNRHRSLVSQQHLFVDIDHVIQARILDYIAPICEAFGVAKDACYFVSTGYGIQAIVPLASELDNKALGALKEPYKYLMAKLTMRLVDLGLIADFDEGGVQVSTYADSSVVSVNGLARLPLGLNVKAIGDALREPRAPKMLGRRGLALSYNPSVILPEDIGSGLVKKERPILIDSLYIKQECGFLREAIEKPEKLHEPDFYTVLTLLARMSDGEDVAKKMLDDLTVRGSDSSTLSSMSERVFQLKFKAAQNSFGSACAKISSPQCPSCPHANAIKNPLQLNRHGQLPFTEKGKPLATLENLKEILLRLGVIVKYNPITKNQDLFIPNKEFLIDNKQTVALAQLVSECSKFKFPIASLDLFLSNLADENIYNPVKVWLESAAWDLKSRLEDFYATVKAVGEDSEPTVLALKKVLLKKWMLTGIALATEPNIAAQGLLVLQGAQGLGKTEWFKNLVDESMSQYIKDGLNLNPQDKDSVKRAVSYWLVELGELNATVAKGDIDRLKAFITNTNDVLRLPYAPRESVLPRRTLFMGTVNPTDFLNDPTGSRRFWTIACESINARHGLNMQQVWAEIYYMRGKGESQYLTHAEEAALLASNEAFQVTDPVELDLQDSFDWSEDRAKWRGVSGMELLRSMGMEKITPRDISRLKGFYTKRGYPQKRIFDCGVERKIFLCPSLKIKPTF